MPAHFSLDKFRSLRGYVLVLAFVISSLVMPRDVISMMIMAGSIFLLYEIGLFCARFLVKK